MAAQEQQPQCGEPGCTIRPVGFWAWKCVDVTVAVPYCEAHSAVIKAKVETAGRKAGGTALADLRN